MDTLPSTRAPTRSAPTVWTTTATAGRLHRPDVHAPAGLRTRVLLNEYNAVDPDRYLEGTGSDPYWGRVYGNGGDWFELVVVQDHLDLRGWQLVMEDAPATPCITSSAR